MKENTTKETRCCDICDKEVGMRYIQVDDKMYCSTECSAKGAPKPTGISGDQEVKPE